MKDLQTEKKVKVNTRHFLIVCLFLFGNNKKEFYPGFFPNIFED